MNTRMTAVLKDAEEEEVVRTLDQLADTTALVLKNIEDTVRLLGMNDAFTDYQRLSDKSYFRSFHDHYDLERISEYARFLTLRAAINHNLEQFATTATFIQSVYFYDPGEKEVFSLEFIPSPVHSFPEKAWYRAYPGLDGPDIIGPVSDRNGRRVLHVVYPDAVYGGGTFVVTIDLARFYDFLWQQVRPVNTHEIFVLDGDGNPMVYNPASERDIYALAWSIDPQTHGLRKVSMDTRELLIGSTSGNYLNWSFHSLNNDDRLVRAYMENRRYFIWVILPLSVVILVLLLVLRKALYSPIDRVMHRIESDEISDVPADEIKRLEDWMDRAESERDTRESLLSQTIPAYRDEILNRKFDGDNVGTRDSGKHIKLADMDLPNIPKTCRVAGLFIEPISEQSVLARAISRWCDMADNEVMSIHRDDLVLIIADGTQISHAELCKVVELLVHTLNTDVHGRVYPTVGRNIWEVQELEEALVETRKELKDYLKLGFETPLESVGEPAESGLPPLKLSEDFADNLLDAIVGGGTDEADTVVKGILDSAVEAGQPYRASEMQHYYLRMAISLMTRVRDRGYDSEFVSSDGTDILVTLVGQRTLDGVYSVFIGLCRDICRYLNSTNTDDRVGRYVRSATLLMEQQLGEDISLTSIAGQLGLSPAYLSRLFKEVRRESFTQFLTSLRMQRSKNLLETSSLNIGEIGQNVGYWSNNHFIKVFRKAYGVTPGEYRRRHQQMEITSRI